MKKITKGIILIVTISSIVLAYICGVNQDEIIKKDESGIEFENANMNDNYNGLRQIFRVVITPSNNTEYEVIVPAILYKNSQVAKVLESLEIINGTGNFTFLKTYGVPCIKIVSGGPIELYVYRSNSDRSNTLSTTTIDSYLYDLSISSKLENLSSVENIYTKIYAESENKDLQLNISYSYFSDDGWFLSRWIEFCAIVDTDGWFFIKVTKGEWGE